MSDATTATSTLPLLTAELPGVGGEIKRFHEDFIVDEIPMYAAGGSGTHLYLTIEKHGITTLEAVRQIAAAAGRRSNEVGYAGMKDAHAVTRQTLSIEHVNPDVFKSADFNKIKILSIDRHTNKLKLGHSKGNRFTIKVRDVADDAAGKAQAVVDVLTRRGVPNYFGPQRFGVRGDNWLVGRSVIMDDHAKAMSVMLGEPGPFDQGEVITARTLFDQGRLEEAAEAWPPRFGQQRRILRTLIHSGGNARKAWRNVDHTLRRLFLSAFQSHLFNSVVADRIAAIDRIELGDVAQKHINGACFRVEDEAAEQPRCERFEISATGPIFGRRMTEPSGRPAEREQRALEEAGVEADQFRAMDGIKLDGGRRPIRAPLDHPVMQAGEDRDGRYLQLEFALPAGSYATCVMREICKNDQSID